MDELLIDRPAVGTSSTWEAISPPENSQDDEHSVHRGSTSSVGLCHGGASVESYLPPRYMSYVFFSFFLLFLFYLHDWSSKCATYRPFPSFDLLWRFIPRASPRLASPCLAALDFRVFRYKRGKQVGAWVNTVIPLGPDCMSYQTLEFWEKGKRGVLVRSVLLGAQVCTLLYFWTTKNGESQD